MKEHLKTHNMSLDDYYEKYIEKVNPAPRCECGEKLSVKRISSNKQGRFNKYCNNKDCRELNRLTKRKETILQKYGVEHAQQSKIVREKTEKTCLKKYGTSTVLGNKNIQDKIEKTNLKKYGVKRTTSLKSFHKKRNKIMIEKYGTDCALRIPEVLQRFNKTRQKNYLTYLSDKLQCTDYKIFSTEENKFQIQHICGNIFEFQPQNGSMPRCDKCFPIEHSSSIAEKELYQWLTTILPENEIIQNNFFTLNKNRKEIDIYLPNKKIGIEIDGIYWHSELSGKKARSYHINKTKFFKNFDINVLHIWDIEWNNKKEIIQSIIMNKLGLSKNNIAARK
jgi:hypothetical protein